MYNHRGKAGYKRDWLGRKTDKRRSPKDEYICSKYNLTRTNFQKECSSHYIRSEVLTSVNTIIGMGFRGSLMDKANNFTGKIETF